MESIMSEIFEDVEELLHALDDESRASSNEKEYQQDLYKKWFRSKTQSGFLSIRPWHQALKMRIDIGKTSSEGKLLSSTAVFLDSVDFASYLKSITNLTATTNYPVNDRIGLPTAESFASYGGAMIDGKPVSRIFKSHYWQAGETYDTSSFVWKCGHFAARKSESGAFIPDMKSVISVDSIKVTRQDICSISYLIDLSMISYAAHNEKWYHA